MLRVELDGIIFALQGIGGISVYHSELLKSSSNNVHYLVGLPSETSIDPRLIDLQQHQIKLKLYPARRLERVRRYAPDVLFRPNVVHTSYYRALADPGVPLVVTAHDFIVETLGPKSAKQRLHVFQKKQALMKASRIIAISESTRNDLERFYGAQVADKVTVIRNGISDSFRAHSTSSRKNQVMFVGSRAPYKGFDAAVEVASLLGDVRLTIVGGGPLSNVELALLHRLLPERFKHIGYVTQSELVRIYNESIFLLYLSSYEGFGIPPVEAARCGCIPVVFNTSSLPEVVATPETMFPVGTKPADIAAHLRDMSLSKLEDIRMRGVIFSNGLSWRRTASETEQVYKKLGET